MHRSLDTFEIRTDLTRHRGESRHQKIVSANYLESEWTEFGQTLLQCTSTLARSRLGSLHVIVSKFVTDLCPLIDD